MPLGPSDTAAGEALSLAGAGRVLIDVREQDEWDRSHSPLARLVPMSELQERIEEIPRNEPILIVCHSGVRSAQVAAALRAADYDASSVAGGMIAWHAAGGELDAEGGADPRVD